MLHLVLFRPEIPQNTGNVGRLCAFTDSRLHIVRPMGFTITDKHLKRSGMDYWYDLDLHIHDDWQAFRAAPEDVRPRRLWLLTTRATQTIWDADFQDGDGLVFGSESAGAPDWMHEELAETRITIPRFAEKPLRSLNLSTSAGIATYEALRRTASPVKSKR